MSWISIVFYLWKNTFRRWLESPISPLSKVLLVFVLSFFAAAILSLFKGVEQEISERLARRELNTVIVTELVSGQKARLRLHESIGEETMWAQRYGKEKINHVWRAGASAEWRDQRVNVYAFSSPELFSSVPTSPDAIPEARLLFRSDSQFAGKLYQEIINFDDRELSLSVGLLPRWMEDQLKDEMIIVGPLPLLTSFLERGFLSYTVAELQSLEEVSRYEREIRAFHSSEGNRIDIISATSVLEDLEKLQILQRKARTALITGCGLLLAAILSSMAWLEFRDDRFLLALLRSFGTPRLCLLLHSFAENLVLVASAIALVPFIWGILLEKGMISLARLGIYRVQELAWQELEILVAAGAIGSLLAILPVAVGLKKQVGLVLS